MKTFFIVTNDWNADTLSNAGTWVNGRDTTDDRATAERMMADYLIDHPEDAGRLTVNSFEIADEDLAWPRR